MRTLSIDNLTDVVLLVVMSELACIVPHFHSIRRINCAPILVGALVGRMNVISNSTTNDVRDFSWVTAWAKRWLFGHPIGCCASSLNILLAEILLASLRRWRSIILALSQWSVAHLFACIEHRWLREPRDNLVILKGTRDTSVIALRFAGPHHCALNIIALRPLLLLAGVVHIVLISICT